MILFKYLPYTKDKDVIPFPVPLGIDAVLEIAWDWLQTKPVIERDKDSHWDDDYDHDGHNSSGWRVYCEDWGHVAEKSGALVAIKPIHLWHGK